MTTWRRRLEQQVGPFVVVASRVPRFVPFLVVGALLVAGLWLEGVLGGLLLLLLAVLLSVLLLLSWPALLPSARLLRLLVLALLVGRAVSFLT